MAPTTISIFPTGMANHPTLMLYMDDRFNNFIQLGRVWFQPVPVEQRTTSCVALRMRTTTSFYSTAHGWMPTVYWWRVQPSIRYGDLGPGNVEGQKLWPPPLIFDLHRGGVGPVQAMGGELREAAGREGGQRERCRGVRGSMKLRSAGRPIASERGMELFIPSAGAGGGRRT